MGNKINDLTPLQLGIWSRVQLYGENNEYMVPLLMKFNISYSKYDIETAVNKVVEYNAALRTEIVTGNQPLQRINQYNYFEIQEIEVENNEIYKEITKFLDIPISLKDRLANFKLFRCKNFSILACKFHHIIIDGISVKLFEKELKSHINKENDFKDPELYEKSLKNLNINDKNTIGFWGKYLKNVIPESIEVRKEHRTDSGRNILLTDLMITQRQFEDYAFRYNTTPFIVGATIFNIFLNRFFNKVKCPMSIPISVRQTKNDDNTISFLSNVLPIINDISEYSSFEDGIKQTQLLIVELINNANISALELNKMIHEYLGKDNGDLNTFIFDLQYEECSKELELIKKYSINSEYYWINNLVLKEGNLYLETNVNVSKFSSDIINEFHKSFKTFMTSIIMEPSLKLEEHPIINCEQIDDLINEINNTQTFLKQPEHKTSLNEKIAIYYRDIQLTYKDLNIIYIKFKNYLDNLEIIEGSKILVCTDSKLINVILFYCIQKSNMCYIATSRDTPLYRYNQIVQEAKPAMIFNNIHRSDENNINLEENIIENIETIFKTYFSIWETRNSDIYKNYSYIIFTSGSTGIPKGVPISVENLKSLINEYSRFNIGESDVVAQVSSFSFDASIFEMTLAFSNYASLAIFNDELGYEMFPHFINSFKVSHFLLTPDYYSILDFTSCKSLKVILVGGAPYRKNSTIPDQTIVLNAYGPSECTIITTIKEMDKNVQFNNIGKPLNNSSIIILDDKNRLLPKGSIGEICILGDSVFSGYLANKENLTTIQLNSKYVTIFKTGDLAYYDENWDLHFVTRKSNMIKIRGNRVNPEEISQLLISNIESVVNCTTIYYKEQLHTFYVGKIDDNILYNEIMLNLPPYMKPQNLIQLENIPTNTNGKTDINALEKLIDDKKTSDNTALDNITNSTFLQTQILEVFQEVLCSSDLTIHSNFYAFGGDSIKSIQIAYKLQNKGINITSIQIMNSNSILELSQIYKEKNYSFDQKPYTGLTNLSPIQKWFFHHDFKNINHWTQSTRFTVTGKFKANDFFDIYYAIKLKHDALRTRFSIEKNNITSKISPINTEVVEKEFRFYSLHNDKIEDSYISVLNNMYGELDIFNGILSKFSVIEKIDNEFEIIWVIHHLICDNVSWLILKNDFIDALSKIKKNQPLVLLNKTSNIHDWSSYILNKNIPVSSAEKWQAYLTDDQLFNNNLEIDNTNSIYDTLMYEINSRLTSILTSYSEKRNISLDVLLLCLFGRVMSNLLNIPSIWITREMNGRENFPEKIQLHQTVGWLTCVYPIKIKYFNNIDEHISFNHFEIENISQISQDYQLLNDIMSLPNISYNYIGDFPETIDITNNDINKYDFFDEISLNAGIQDNKLLLILMFKENRRTIVNELLAYIEEEIEKLNTNSSKNTFGISMETLGDLEDLLS